MRLVAFVLVLLATLNVFALTSGATYKLKKAQVCSDGVTLSAGTSVKLTIAPSEGKYTFESVTNQNRKFWKIEPFPNAQGVRELDPSWVTENLE
jgi:hypothetical protein